MGALLCVSGTVFASRTPSLTAANASELASAQMAPSYAPINEPDPQFDNRTDVCIPLRMAAAPERSTFAARSEENEQRKRRCYL
jgi:hypothetical protein